MNTASNDYRRLAPSVEPAWVETFVFELRMLEVPGTRIGDALALVESHVTESGESARESFGDPAEYARESERDRTSESLDLSWILGTVFGLLGMLLTIFGVQAWFFEGGVFELSVGTVVLIAMVLAALALVHFAADRVLRFVVKHTWISVVLFSLWSAAVVGMLLLLPTVVAVIPAVIVAVLGVVALVVGSVLEWRSRSAEQLDDPIVGPGELARPRMSWFARVTVLLFPILTVVMLCFGVLLNALS